MNEMKSYLKKLWVGVLCLALLSACATYHLSTQSLMTQFADTQKETKINVIVAFPIFFPGVVTGNNLREIKCLDKNEQEKIIPVTNHTGIKITKKDGKSKIFYFDTLILQDSIINGAESHFFGLSIKPINLNEIEKIEIQK